MIAGLTAQQLAFFAILLTASALLLTERLRNDIVAVLIILALYLTGVLDAEQALAGFSSEAAIVVAAIFVLSAGLNQTGLSESIGATVGRLAGRSYTRVLAVIMVAVAVLSAFTHHLTMTAIMLPVTLNLSRERAIAPSKLLMPLSIAASLGTTITIIGAPAFLIASSVLQQAGRPGLGIFAIAPIGLALTVSGTLFMLTLGRLLLPDRGGNDEGGDRFRIGEYFTEVTVLPDSPFLERTVGEISDDPSYQLHVVGLLRNGRQVGRRVAEQRVHAGDVLLVRTSPEELVAMREERGVELQPVTKYQIGEPTPTQHGDESGVADRLVQAVVAPYSDLADRTIGAVDFRRRYGVIVVSMWRKDGDGWLSQELSQVRLRPGDVLVLEGDPAALDRVAADQAFLMLVPFQGEPRVRRRRGIAALIMLTTVVAAGLGLLSIEMASIAGAAAMILSGCLRARQAYRAIDARIFVFIAGAIPLGAAMQESGASELLAGWMEGTIAGWSPVLILLALFSIVAILTQFMSDAATTAIFAPVAIALSSALGHAPEPYVVTVAMAAVASFLTPIGHHGNLLVYTPGRYQFADFVRVGAPLTVVIGLIVALLAPLIWPL